MQSHPLMTESPTAPGTFPIVGDTSGSRFRLNNGTTAGPQSEAWGQHASSRMTQGVVTATTEIAKMLYEMREANNESLSDEQRIGTIKGTEDLNVREHELLFGMKNRGAGRSGSSSFGFSSFNAQNTLGFKTQDDFEDNVRFLGRAKGPYFFNSPDQGNQGVATQVRGACSTANRGAHEFFVGDRVRYRLPNISRYVRENEKKEFHMPEGMSAHKELAHLEPVTYGDTHRLPQRAYAAYVDEAKRGDERVRTRNAAAPSRLVRFAITYLRAAGLAKLYAGVAVLVEKGILTFGGQFRSPVDPTAYAEALKTANVPLAKDSIIGGDEAKGLATLAYLLDLVPARARDTYIEPAGVLIADIIEAQHRGLAGDGTLEKRRLPLSRFLKPSGLVVAGTAFAEDGALDRMQENAVRREVQSFAETKQREDEKIIGVALNHAFAGQILDYVS